MRVNLVKYEFLGWDFFMAKNSTSLVDQIAAVLEKRLRSGFYPENKALPGSRSIAEEFGCSFQTADRAILKLVDARLVERRRGSGSYPLSSKRRIVLLLPGANQPQQPNFTLRHQQMIQSIYCRTALEAIRRYNCAFEELTFPMLESRNFSPQLLRNADGVLAHTTFSDSNTLDLLIQAQIPVVYFGPGTPCWPMSSVVADWQAGLREMFKCYTGKHNFIIFDTPGRHDTPGNVTYEIFQAAEACGLAADQLQYCQLALKSGQTAELEGYKLGMKIDLQPDTVIITTSDLLGFGFYDALRDRGLQPGEFELISCDNLESRGVEAYEKPQLTSIDHPKETITCQAVDLLFDLIKNPTGNRLCITVPTKLVRRSSGLVNHKE